MPAEAFSSEVDIGSREENASKKKVWGPAYMIWKSAPVRATISRQP